MNDPRRLFLPVLLATALIGTAACQNDTLPGSSDFRSSIDSVSYSLGFFYGSSIAQEGIDDFNYTLFLEGLRTAAEEQEPHFDEMSMQVVMQNFQMELQQRQESVRHEEAGRNREEGERFLQENAGQDDITVTDSGLQYRVIEQGDGDRPSAESTVRVHYRGTLLDGEEFDSSHSRGEPAEFPLNRVIPGWTEGVQLMQEGSTYEFFIPADLAYGDNPPPGSPIGPGAVLRFEIELLSVLD